jgi:hypothetical protein
MFGSYMLSAEEKNFLKENIKCIKEICKYYNNIRDFLMAATIVINEGELREYRKGCESFGSICFGYLMPLILRLYESTIDLLKKGQFLAAGCLFRTLIEAYIDISIIFQDPTRCERYYDYNVIVYKRINDQDRKIFSFPEDMQQEIFLKESCFLKKYNIRHHDELKTWSGISVRKMAYSLNRPNNQWWKGVYSFYNLFSNYTHPSSGFKAMLEESEKPEDMREDVLSEHFSIPIFFGGFMLCLICKDLREDYRAEGCDKHDVDYEKLQSAFNNLKNLNSKYYEWHGFIDSFYS